VKNFITRSITGLIYVIAVIGCILGGKSSFAVLCLFFTAVGLHEFFTIHQNNGLQPLRRLGVASGMTLFLAFFFYARGLFEARWFILFILLFLAFLVIEMYRNKSNPFGNIAVTLLGLAYIGLPLSLLNFLVFPSIDGVYIPNMLIMVFVLIWAFDTGAYIAGILMGKHKLFPRLSPKKSWEGVIGGTILTILVALLISHYYKPVDTLGMICAACLTALGATFGDLAESMLKRSVDIKDSGKLLPGHGGLLDRIDSLLFVGPIIYVFISFYH
jgi:phosphatidate cytidylyltransferase